MRSDGGAPEDSRRFSPFPGSSGVELPEDGTRGQTETYFYQREVRSTELRAFLFSHIAFIFLECAYCTLDSGYVC